MLAHRVIVVAMASKVENVGSQFLSLRQLPLIKYSRVDAMVRKISVLAGTMLWTAKRRVVKQSLSPPFSLIASAALRQVRHGEPGAIGLSRMPMARNPARDGNAVGPVPIADQVAWGLIPRERFSNLLRDPFGRRVCPESGLQLCDEATLTSGVGGKIHFCAGK
jgi:hypothetical protein